ncbi:uncharacterized protein LOC125065901 [Vanessa atalanta]|uniref:uncharacterized protein LOC125065901 n=1 Tax=Vanessa atalanta TaxID=42275 RepID=UPI001FCD4C76|nr:uncharacterized protein LOC125065901 [Vanessa atalanta]
MKNITIFLTLFVFGKFLKASEIIHQAATIANQVYTLNVLTSVVWWRYDQHNVTHFLKKFKGSVVTVKISYENFKDTHFHKTVLYKQTVFFAAAPDEFEYFVERINQVIVVPIRVIMILSNQWTNSVDAFTKIAWKNDIGDIIILRIDPKGKIRYSTYKPYGNGSCANYTALDLNINTRVNETFFIRKYKNFHSCPIRVTMLEFIPFVELRKENHTITEVGGVDGILLKLLLERLNSSLDAILYKDHISDTDKNKTDFLDDLSHNVADIIIPGLVWTSKRYAVVQVSYSYNSINVVWCMPKRREIHEWAKILLPFINVSTLLILGGFFFMFIIMKLVNRIAKKSDSEIIFRMLGIFLGQDIRYYSSYWLINSLYNFWIWFCIIVRISYQGNLIDGLRKTILEPKISSVDEAMQVVDGVGGSIAFIEYYRNTSIENKFIKLKLKNITSYINDIGAGKRFLLAVDLLQVKFYNQAVQILEENVTTMPKSFYMRPRWSASSEISRTISHIVESGLYMKIQNDIILKLLVRNEKLSKIDDSLKPMGMELLKSCFYGLICMYIISSVVFTIEMLWSKYKIKKT